MKNSIRVENPSEHPFVSGLLNQLLSEASQQGERSEVASKKPMPDQKGEIVIAILIGLATSAIYDVIKSGLARFGRSNEIPENVEILIDGKKYKLDEF